MHGLWSRAARAHSCHCKICIRSTAPIARPSVTPAPKPRNFSTVSHEALRKLESICYQQPRRFNTSQNHDEICRIYRSRRKPLPRAGLVVGLNALQEALLLEESRMPFQRREVRNPVQLARAADATNRLVENLLEELYRAQHPDDPAAQQAAKQSLDSAWTGIRLLRSEGYPRYRHPDLDSEDAISLRRELTQANNSLFADWERCKKAALSTLPRTGFYRRPKHLSIPTHFISKICYNLLVSSVPLSIHNYNNLLLGFLRVKEPAYAQIVADALHHHTLLRPTQQTHICLLHHYQVKEDMRGFYRMIRNLMALDTHGPRIRRKSLKDVQSSSALRTWALTSDVSFRNGIVMERARRNQGVYEAMIRGLLFFNQSKDAALVYAACLAESHSLSSHLVLQLANRISANYDREGADVLIRALTGKPVELQALLLHDDTSTSKLSHTKRLCRALERVLELRRIGLPGEIWPISAQRRQTLANALFLANAREHCRVLDIFLAQFGHKLGRGKASDSMATDMIGRLLVWRGAQLQNERERRHYIRMATFHHLICKIGASERALANLAFDFIRTLTRPDERGLRPLLTNGSLLPAQQALLGMLQEQQFQRLVVSALSVGEKLAQSVNWEVSRILSQDVRERIRRIYGPLVEIPLEIILDARAEHLNAQTRSKTQFVEEGVAMSSPRQGYSSTQPFGIFGQAITPQMNG
ncbi:uncharacterized protein E0L32_008859 [Thyridium curvatum]|uniref:Pentatricopeptide repeat domain-containing protein n=1 Tax=Thyridium curvatum TaxID=1093900 RepID=A0A507AKB6_9PEZI|nr:uncharacterized protein E0L32_008859 [Thyridium curvatum]TPX10012.1 hypothetical protein E0L32_008859 [Thyridium curvatum]